MLSTESISTIQSKRNWRPDKMIEVEHGLFDPPHNRFTIRARSGRERHGSAHATAQRDPQRCLTFSLEVNPLANIILLSRFLRQFRASLRYSRQATALLNCLQRRPWKCSAPPILKACAKATGRNSMQLVSQGDYWEMLLPSHYARSTGLLEELRE